MNPIKCLWSIAYEVRELIIHISKGCTLIFCPLVGDTHASHFALKDSLAAARQVNATKTYLVGTTHRVDHYEMEASLASLEKEEGLRVAPAFDGLRILFNNDKTLTETSYLDEQSKLIGATS